MNLLQIREMFKVLSGRYDLVNEDNINVVNFMVNEGAKFLDRLSETQKMWGTNYAYLAQGGWNLQIQYCRAVKEVWISTTTARWQLEKKDLQWMLTELMSEKVSLLTQGSPLYYSPTLTRNIGTLPAGIASYVDTIVTSGELYNAILILPPPDQQMLVEVKGFFRATELVNDTDENFWTVAHPSVLIKAALRELEVFNQNQSKVKSWEESIALELDGINKDLVEELVAEVSEMEG